MTTLKISPRFIGLFILVALIFSGCTALGDMTIQPEESGDAIITNPLTVENPRTVNKEDISSTVVTQVVSEPPQVTKIETEEATTDAEKTMTEPTVTSVREGETSSVAEDSKEVNTVQVTVVVSENIAHVLHKKAPPTAESQDLFETTNKLGIVLEPMHPGIDEPLMMVYFVAEAPDSTAADQVVEHLLQTPGVEGAYVKPADELPSN